MKKLNRPELLIVLCIIIISSIYGCARPKVIVHHVNTQMTKDGVYYALPKTKVTLKLKLIQNNKTKGKLIDDQTCRKVLEVLNVKGIKESTVSYSLGKDKEIGVAAEADPANIYLVELDGGFLEKREILIKLTEAGLITEFESTVTDMTLEVAVKTLEAAGRVTSSVLAFDSPTESSECLMILEKVQEIREKKLLILSKHQNATKELVEFELKKLDELEVSTLIPITGSVTNNEWDVLLTVDPNQITETNKIHTETLFTVMSTNCNVVLGPNHADLPMPKEFREGIPKPTENQTSPTCKAVNNPSYFVEIHAPSTQSMASVVKLHKHDSAKSGIRYRVPENAKVYLKIKKADNSSVLASNTVPIAQLGPVVALPASLGDKQTKYKINFYTNTGALKEVGTTADTIDPATVGAAGEPIGSFIDAVRTQESTGLSEEVNVLKLKIEKKKLEDELNDLNASTTPEESTDDSSTSP